MLEIQSGHNYITHEPIAKEAMMEYMNMVPQQHRPLYGR